MEKPANGLFDCLCCCSLHSMFKPGDALHPQNTSSKLCYKRREWIMIIWELISYRNYQIKLCLLKTFDDNIGNIFHFYSTLPIAITYARLEVVSILEGCSIYNEKYSKLRFSVAKFTSTFANVELTNTCIQIFWYCISSQISNNTCCFSRISFTQN